MPGSIGYEPNGLSSERTHANRVTSDLIRVLPLLESYKPSDRLFMKNSILKMLKSIGCVWMLQNIQRSVESTHQELGRGSERRPRQLFSPGPNQPHPGVEFESETGNGASKPTQGTGRDLSFTPVRSFTPAGTSYPPYTRA